MNKRFLLAALPALVLSTSPAFAYNNSIFDGFYVGGSVGAAFTVTEASINENTNYLNATNGGNLITVLNHPLTMKKDAFKGDIFAGYGYSWRSLYIGAELFVIAENAKQSITVNSIGTNTVAALNYDTSVYTSTKIDPFQYGIDFRPGFLITPTTLLYGRAGTSFSTVKINTSSSLYVRQPGTDLATQSIAATQNKNVATLRLGAGLEQHINDRFSIRADYIYTYYAKLSANSGSPITTLLSGNTVSVTNKTSAKITDNAVLLGLAYSFC